MVRPGPIMVLVNLPLKLNSKLQTKVKNQARYLRNENKAKLNLLKYFGISTKVVISTGRKKVLQRNTFSS